ncbi:MAG: carboxypeptidase regulatory-like domain-containing protein [Bacteroidia bacterium]|nr:carboxypeptidase regulatory-like domain-containing protein [Bacteroidia bacterium]
MCRAVIYLKNIKGTGFYLFILLLACLLYIGASTQTNKWAIEVKGAVTENSRKLPGAVITVYAGGSAVNTINSSDGRFDFNLSSGTDYMISFTKAGYITKQISFSTKNVPAERVSHGFDPYTSISEVDIFPLMTGGNFEARLEQLLQQPIAKVAYSPTLNGGKGDFTYDADYSASMHEKIQKIIDDYDAFNAKYKELIKKADGEFRDKDYNTAKSDYTAALNLKPGEAYPKEMIAKCDSAMAAQHAKPAEPAKKPDIKSLTRQPVKPAAKPVPETKSVVQAAPPPARPAAPPVHVTVCPCIMSKLNDSCRKYLKPFYYDDANTMHLQPKTFAQVKEINFPGFNGQRFRIVINITAMPAGTTVTVYDEDKNHKSRKPLYTISDSGNRIGFADVVCKTGRFYVEYNIPPSQKEMCALIMFGYESH